VIALLLSTPRKLFELRAADVWFQADVARVLQHMTDPARWMGRVNVHPVFPLATAPAVNAIETLTGMGGLPTAAVVLAAVAAGIVAAFWFVLRSLGRSQVEAFLLTLLLMSSSTWLFWFSVTETYPLGALTILLALLIAAGKQTAASQGRAVLIGIAAATFFATITNGMFGLLLLWLRSAGWRIFLLRVAGAGMIVAMLFLFQHWLFFTKNPADNPFTAESKFLLTEASGGPLAVSKVLLLDTLVAPKLEHINTDSNWSWLSMQRSRPGSGSRLAPLALALWISLLALGVAGFWRARKRVPGFFWLLATGFVGQWLLHVLYGEESFLYAFHLLPLLGLFAAFAFEWTAPRKLVTAAVSALIVLCIVNNVIVLREARAHVASLDSANSQVTIQRNARPEDDWPRPLGRLVVGSPGSALTQKGFLEPGGSFSPAPGSFGISWWVTDSSGRRVATSATTEVGETSQCIGSDDAGRIYADFVTPLYRGRWTRLNGERWSLHIEASQAIASDHKLSMVLRGVGPAAGPLNSIEWDLAGDLRLNNRWRILLPAGASVGGLDESLHGLNVPMNQLPIESVSGWAFARVSLDLPAVIEVEDLQPVANASTVAFKPRSPALNLPDPRFAESLRSQVTQLTCAIQGRRVVPFDPFVVPDAWARVSAQAVAALARSGNGELARPLALELAEHDFYGPFGSEADALGLALWAIEEVSARAADPELDQILWPHVRRKADMILKFAGAKTLQFAPPEYSYADRYQKDLFVRNETGLVCLPAVDGLIAGRCERWISPLHVTAVSYRGLIDAAALARRIGMNAEADVWVAEADRLKHAWLAHVRGDKTGRAEHLRYIAGVAEEGWRLKDFYLARDAGLLAAKQADEGEQLRRSALWPTWIGAEAGDIVTKNTIWSSPKNGNFSKNLQSLFTLAHQRLLQGEQAGAWEMLLVCWSRQVVPGAYIFPDTWIKKTWLEDNWDNLRCGVNGAAVAPSARVAAEVLSLQLDMLAYLDESGPEPIIVVGAGVPAEWLKQPMSVAGLSLKGATVDWSWDGHELSVIVQGRHFAVRTASSFVGRPCAIEFN
jgi:hypothetical protein